MRSPVTVRGEAAEVALCEAEAVLAMVGDPKRRARLAGLVTALGKGEVAGEEAEALEELLELGLETGRLRARYGPGAEQAALRVYRQLPRGRELGKAAREVSGALAVLEGRTLESVRVRAVGPGDHVLSLGVEGLELSVRLDRQGARLASVGT